MGGSVELGVFEEVYSVCRVQPGYDFGVGRILARRLKKPCLRLRISFAKSTGFGTAPAVRVGFVTYSPQTRMKSVNAKV